MVGCPLSPDTKLIPDFVCVHTPADEDAEGKSFDKRRVARDIIKQNHLSSWRWSSLTFFFLPRTVSNWRSRTRCSRFRCCLIQISGRGPSIFFFYVGFPLPSSSSTTGITYPKANHLPYFGKLTFFLPPLFKTIIFKGKPNKSRSDRWFACLRRRAANLHRYCSKQLEQTTTSESIFTF